MMKARKRCLWHGCQKPRAGGNAGKYCACHALESKRASQRSWRRKDRKAPKAQPVRKAIAPRVITECECACHELAMRLMAGKI